MTTWVTTNNSEEPFVFSSILKMEAAGLFEMSMPTFHAIRCHNLDDLDSNFDHRENTSKKYIFDTTFLTAPYELCNEVVFRTPG
jgi:hypothetical protein